MEEGKDQAPEQSLEDRIAAQFDDVEDEVEEQPTEDEPEAEVEAEAETESDEAPSDEDSDPVETIEIEGVEYEVPQALKESFLRQQDYTQKTQKVADTMRALELQQAELEQAKQQQEFYQSISQELTQINQLDAYLQQQRDWNSMSSEEMMRTKLELDSYKEYRQQLAQVVEQKQKEFNESQQKAHKELLEKGQEALRKTIQGWDDGMAKAVSEYALAQGFPEKEVKGIKDPRWVVALHKARLYDELQANTTQAIKAAKDVPAIKPKAERPMPEAVKRRLNQRNAIKRAKTPQEKETAVLNRLADMF